MHTVHSRLRFLCGMQEDVRSKLLQALIQSLQETYRYLPFDGNSRRRAASLSAAWQTDTKKGQLQVKFSQVRTQMGMAKNAEETT